jgi:hypothetical protein
MCTEHPYSHEEQVLADQIAKNAGVIVECQKHPMQYYKPLNRLDTLNRIDSFIMKKQDDLLKLINRSDIQRKALVMIALRDYGDRCPRCPRD